MKCTWSLIFCETHKNKKPLTPSRRVHIKGYIEQEHPKERLALILDIYSQAVTSREHRTIQAT